MSKKPGVLPSLTRDEIAAKALELADAEGIGNVSMRKLAAALGKSPMALYTYFESIREIRVDAVVLGVSGGRRRARAGGALG